MPFKKGQSGNPKGREPGSRNQRTLDGEAYAKAIVEDAKGRARLLRDFQQGKLPPQVLLHLFQLAYGTPKELTVYAIQEVRPDAAATAEPTPTRYYLSPITAAGGDAGAVAAPSARPVPGETTV